MAKKCAGCDGWGMARDASRPDGWKRDGGGNAITCPECGGEGRAPGEPADMASPDLAEQRG